MGEREEKEDKMDEEIEECPEDKAVEREIIKKILDREEMKTGETWYLISRKWFRCWKEFVGYDGHSYGSRNVARPDEIPNNELMIKKQNGWELRETLISEHDYTVVSAPVWKRLVKWYGGGPEIARPVIETGYNRRKRVETYPLEIKIVHNAKPTEYTTYKFSRGLLVSEMKKKVCEDLKLEPTKITVFSYQLGTKGLRLTENETLDESRLSEHGAKILFEEEGVATPVVPAQQRYTGSSSNYSSSSSGYSMLGNYGGYSGMSGNYSAKVDEGLTGLSNLGNTCFMNSALQCLSNTVELTEYFLNDRFVQEINRDNPLGMGGKIAEEYGKLIKEIWAGKYSSVAPRDFKITLGKFAPQFSGYAQHDSQELLSFLLDGLHEDLNRVIKKPLVEQYEVENGEDHEIAAECWKRHQLRNKSVIVDYFQAQYKSTLTCPQCSKISITFDPFMYLSLPLPEKKTRIIRVQLLKYQKECPILYSLKVNKNASITDLCNILGEVAGVDPKYITVSEVMGTRIHKIYDPRASVSEINSSDKIVAFELEPFHPEQKPITVLIRIPHYGSLNNYASFIIPYTPETTWRNITKQCWDRVSCFLKKVKTDNKMDDSDSDEEEEEFNYEESRKYINVRLAKERNIGGEMADLDTPMQFDKSNIIVIDFLPEGFNRLDQKKAMLVIQDESVKTVTEDQVRKSVTLLDCVDAFVQEEKLGMNDLWYCPRCKDFTQATKKLDLYSLPDVLVIHLKRFAYNRYSRDKLDTVVDFPLQGLVLSNYVTRESDKNAVYDLFAVSNHFGGMGGGHYTAFALNKTTKKWYNFDDSSVREVSTDRIVSTNAYVLFYRRRGADSGSSSDAASNSNNTNTNNNNNNTDQAGEA